MISRLGKRHRRWCQTATPSLHPVLSACLAHRAAGGVTLQPNRTSSLNAVDIARLARLSGLDSVDENALRDVNALVQMVDPITQVDTSGMIPLVSFAADESREIQVKDLMEYDRGAEESEFDSEVSGRDLLRWSKSVDLGTGTYKDFTE